VQRHLAADIVGFAGEAIVPPAVEQTGAEAGDVDVSGVKLGDLRGALSAFVCRTMTPVSGPYSVSLLAVN
jgi:hypothetical protein